MALSDLAVYSEYAYSASTEVLAQQIELFNAASEGTIILNDAANQGDYNDKTLWALNSSLVRRRNPYGTGSVSTTTLLQLVDTMVKVAAGTKDVRFDTSQLKWIQQDPKQAGAALGKQLAEQILADMLNTSLISAYAAMVQTTAILADVTGASPDTLTPMALVKGASKFGDRAQDIRSWVTHSTPMFDFWKNNITNTEKLFLYGTVAVNRDPFGRTFIVTDSPSLIDTVPSPDVYYVLGLVTGAIEVQRNNDYTAQEIPINGQENLATSFQAEWSYNLGIKGYSWDKTNGGKAPTTAALATSSNWDKYVTSDKDGPGVILKCDFAT